MEGFNTTGDDLENHGGRSQENSGHLPCIEAILVKCTLIDSWKMYMARRKLQREEVLMQTNRHQLRHQWLLPILVVLTNLLATISATAQTQRLTPQHVAKMRSVVSAVVSPDGHFVAYTVSIPRQLFDDPNGSSYTELHVVDREGHSRPFVTGKVHISDVQWTPDGKKIAYVAKRGDDSHASLYLLPIDGGESQKCIEHDSSINDPVFDATGTRIAFLAKEKKPKDLGTLEDHGFDQEIYEEDWQPVKVWVTHIDGSPVPLPLDLNGSASAIEWSPSGKELVVALAPTSLVDDSYMYRRVHVVDAENGQVIERVDNPGKLGAIHWSPDGKHLAMISARDIHDPKDGRLMIATVPGDGSLRDLMPDYEAHVTSFAWQDDGSIQWIAAEGTHTTMGTVTLDGQVTEQIKASGPVLSQLRLANDGSASVVGHSAAHPSEVFLVQKDATLKRVTNSNPWLDQIELAEQETVTWQAEDGLELQGVLTKPLHYVPGRRYPMIMVVHGGPESHIADGWTTSYSRPGQVAAARGFVVFYPNYRGSTGRGVEFSKMGQSDAAGKEFSDLIDAIDALDKRGLIDSDRVGITGGSYGGYASAWGATYYSDRFAASVMFVGISDGISKLGTTDIPDESFLVHHQKRLWEDWEYFLNSSPIKYVERNQTPTLIMHGKRDPRVHPSQSLELHRHLKILGQAPVRLVLYEGEGHGNQKAASRFDYNLRMLRWMEHFLIGDNDEAPPKEIDYRAALKK